MARRHELLARDPDSRTEKLAYLATVAGLELLIHSGKQLSRGLGHIAEYGSSVKSSVFGSSLENASRPPE